MFPVSSPAKYPLPSYLPAPTPPKRTPVYPQPTTQSPTAAMRVDPKYDLWNMYYHHFPFYMLTGPEKAFLHLFLVSFVSFIVYSFYSVIPTYVPFLMSRSYYYLTGGDF